MWNDAAIPAIGDAELGQLASPSPSGAAADVMALRGSGARSEDQEKRAALAELYRKGWGRTAQEPRNGTIPAIPYR